MITPWMKKTDIPKDITSLEPTYYCVASPQQASAIVRKLGYKLPTIGHERNLDNGLWITHVGRDGYEFRRY